LAQTSLFAQSASVFATHSKPLTLHLPSNLQPGVDSQAVSLALQPPSTRLHRPSRLQWRVRAQSLSLVSAHIPFSTEQKPSARQVAVAAQSASLPTTHSLSPFWVHPPERRQNSVS